MPVELRKRKAPAPAPEPPAKKQSKVSKAAAKVKEAVKGKTAKPAKANGATKPTKPTKPVVGENITLDGFGGEIETNDGDKTTLKALVEESKSGVVIFTYPKASTPGCTNQACLFRDAYESLTGGGLAIYGLSADSPKANTTFKTKQKLPYSLLCDPSATLIDALGFKKASKGTTRGVFAVDKAGKVLLIEPGSPAGTFDAVKKLVAESEGAAAEEEPIAKKAEDESAETVAEETKPTNGDASEEKKADDEAE